MRLSKIPVPRLAVAASLIWSIGLAGCSGGTTTLVVPAPSASSGLPAPAAASSVNTYNGAQSPGEWSVTLDNTNNSYSYQAITFPGESNAASSGATTSASGFKRLGNSGYALEIKGRVAVLRPGTSATPIVFSVPQSQCYAIGGRLRFQFIGMETGPDGAVGSAGPTNGYGSFVASTDTSGASWQFQNLQGNMVNGPANFAGKCATSGSLAGIETSATSVLNELWPPDEEIQNGLPSGAQSKIWIGPSGFLVADQSVSNSTPPIGASVAGLAEPSGPLDTLGLSSQVYLGFLYEPATTPYSGSSPSAALTQPVSFGLAGVTGSALIGGVFPNDDVTQTVSRDYSISLGKQDTTINGLYKSVSITVPDPAQNCANYTGSGETATFGFNPDGTFSCTFSGIAIAGNPEGKFAVFVTTYNWAAQLGGAPLQIYLFQQ